MDEARKKAEYAVSNLRVIRASIDTYASYASDLCAKIDHTTGVLYDKMEKAQKDIAKIISYVEILQKQYLEEVEERNNQLFKK